MSPLFADAIQGLYLRPTELDHRLIFTRAAIPPFPCLIHEMSVCVRHAGRLSVHLQHVTREISYAAIELLVECLEE